MNPTMKMSMKNVKKLLVVFIGGLLTLSIFAPGVFANEVDDENETENKTIVAEEKSFNLEAAKEKMLNRVERMEAHLKEVLEKIQSNEKINAQKKENVANGIQKVLERIAAIKSQIQQASTRKELVKAVQNAHTDAKKMHKHFTEMRRQGHKKGMHHMFEQKKNGTQ